jgi:hypothetical protein
VALEADTPALTRRDYTASSARLRTLADQGCRWLSFNY